MKNTDELCEKIERILSLKFKNSGVDASLSYVRNNIHVVIVSRFFDGLTEDLRHGLVYGFLDESDLKEEEIKRISLFALLSPDDVK